MGCPVPAFPAPTATRDFPFTLLLAPAVREQLGGQGEAAVQEGEDAEHGEPDEGGHEGHALHRDGVAEVTRVHGDVALQEGLVGGGVDLGVADVVRPLSVIF